MDLQQHALLGQHFDHGSTGAARAAWEFGIQKSVFEKLWDLYPGYGWRVKTHTGRDTRTGRDGTMVTIQLPLLMHQSLGFNFPVDMLGSDPGMGIVKRAGGEILERWKLRRGKIDFAAYKAARNRKRVHSPKDRPPA